MKQAGDALYVGRSRKLSCRLFMNVEKQKNDYSPATENSTMSAKCDPRRDQRCNLVHLRAAVGTSVYIIGE